MLTMRVVLEISNDNCKLLFIFSKSFPVATIFVKVFDAGTLRPNNSGNGLRPYSDLTDPLLTRVH